MAGPPRHPRRGWPGAVLSGCDALLDVMVLVLATWTLVYHLAVLARLRVGPAMALEAVALALATAVGARLRRAGGRAPGGPGPSATLAPRDPRGARWAVVTVVAAVVAAAAMAVDASWVLVWTSWLAAAGAGTWGAWRRWAGASPDGHAGEPGAASGGPARTEPGAGEVLLAVGAALAAAAFAASILRTNPDDLFYLNISQWVAEHGSFPVRDTLFSDQALPAVNWPPVASYDGLVGAIAHLAGTYAGTVEYVVVPPLTSFLAVLALWRLLRAWQVAWVPVALVTALLFLLLDGTGSYATPGNLFVTRLWQGKVILLCVLVPVLLVRALDHVERSTSADEDRPPGRTTFRLFLAGTAAVGLSTSAMFLAPLLAVAGMAPAVRRAPRAALAGFGALAGYPLATGAVTVALGGRSADEFGSRRLYRFDPAWFGHEIFLTGVLAAVGVLSVLVGALLVPHPAARVTTGLAALMTGLTFVPGATQLGYRVSGLGPTLWRVSWLCTVGALVGVAGAWALAALRTRLSTGWALVAGGLAAVVLAVGGAPVWSAATTASFEAPFHWQRSQGTREVAARVIAAHRPGELVLAPSGLSITLVVTDTDVRTVAPRDYALDRLRGVASFHYRERLLLWQFVEHVGTWRLHDVARALRILHVGTACVDGRDVGRAQALESLGYRPFVETTAYRCLRL